MAGLITSVRSPQTRSFGVPLAAWGVPLAACPQCHFSKHGQTSCPWHPNPKTKTALRPNAITVDVQLDRRWYDALDLLENRLLIADEDQDALCQRDGGLRQGV